ASIQELTNEPTTIFANNPEDSDRSCPRCTRPMISVEVTAGDFKIRGRLMRCLRDGTWLPRDALSSVFARASRALSGMMRNAHGGVTPGPAFHTAADRLAISHW